MKTFEVANEDLRVALEELRAKMEAKPGEVRKLRIRYGMPIDYEYIGYHSKKFIHQQVWQWTIRVDYDKDDGRPLVQIFYRIPIPGRRPKMITTYKSYYEREGGILLDDLLLFADEAIEILKTKKIRLPTFKRRAEEIDDDDEMSDSIDSNDM